MREFHRSVLLLCLGSMTIQMLEHVARGADEAAAQAPAGYASPREAYEAKRKALARRDWRTAFASSTPTAQSLEVENLIRWWDWKTIGMDDYKLEEPKRTAVKARLVATTKKYGVEKTAFSFVALFDEEKFIKTMASRVVDKAAFYEEMSELIRPAGEEAPELIHDIGDLQGIAVSGDSARGWVEWSRKEGRKSARLMRKFRRVDGRWFNDNETWDYTLRRADEAAAQVPAGYASPREAYEAKRKALAGRDWRTAFASSTPTAQALEVENLVGQWILMDGGLGIRGPFVNGELSAVEARAREARLRAFMKKNGVKVPILFLSNEQLLETFKTMAARIPDKATFYEEACERLTSIGREAPESEYDMGDLQGVAESGDTARGWVVWNRDHVYENGVKKVTGTVRVLRKFRKRDGRWFNDNETWDYTPYDPEEAKK